MEWEVDFFLTMSFSYASSASLPSQYQKRVVWRAFLDSSRKIRHRLPAEKRAEKEKDEGGKIEGAKKEGAEPTRWRSG